MLEGASYIGLEALLASAGLSDADIRLEATGFTQVETLATDRVEAVVVYTNNEPVQLAAQGVEHSLINVADYADLVSNGLITSEQTIATQPEQVRAMAEAFKAALAYTIEHPDDAYTLASRYVEGLDDPTVAETQREVLLRSISLWKAARLGESRREAWESMQDVLLTMGLLDTPQDLDAAYSNEFVP
jgi:NitT/TauT family transport system substrate-binding protein